MYEEVAKVSGHVASNTKTQPCFHGTIVSGHLPLDRSRSIDSRQDGIFFAAVRAQWLIALMSAW